MSSPFSLSDLTNNVGLMIWAAIGAVGLVAGFVSVNVAKRRSLKNTEGAATAEQPTAQTEPQTAASAPEPSQAASSESYASTASSSATHDSMGHLTRAG